MKIEKINISDFGCLSGRSFELSSGFNLIRGDNESGKSTLLEFIKFIFYGLPRKTQEDAAVRERSISWKNGCAAGSLTFSLDSGKKYRIERRGILRIGEKRETYSEECHIFDVETGAQVHKGESPGELFLGVPVSVFESTCFVRQSALSSIDAGGVGSALENILLSADENVNLQKSLDKLDLARRTLLHKNGKGGLVYELETEGNDLSSRLEKAKTDHAVILKGNEKTAQMRAQCKEKRHELDRLEKIFSAKGKADILKRFDLLHKKENDLSVAEREWEEYKAGIADSEGRLPSAAYVRELAESAGAYASAYESRSISKRALEVVESELAAAEAELAELGRGLPSPEDIRACGGTDTICEEIEDCSEFYEKSTRAGKKLLTFATVGLALAIATAVSLFFLVSLLSAASAGGTLAIVSAALMIAGLEKKRAGAKKKQRAEHLLSLYGSKDSEKTLGERLVSVRRALTDLIDADAKTVAERERTAAIRSAFDMRHDDLMRAKKNAEELLSRWTYANEKFEGGTVGERLRASVSAAEQFVKDQNDRLGEINLLRTSILDLRAELSGENEKAIRARIPADVLAECEKISADEIDRARKYNADSLHALTEKCVSAEKELLRLEAESENPARLSALLEKNRNRYGEEKLRYDAIVLAAEALSNAGSNIRNSVTPMLRGRAETYLSKLTAGKYSSLGIDESYLMSAHHDGATRSVSLLSAGTRDGAYLSLRLSLLSLVFRAELPFLAVDESLAQLDDKRAKNALGILSAYCGDGGQCLLFTCHGREEAMLKDIGKVNTVIL